MAEENQEEVATEENMKQLLKQKLKNVEAQKI